MLTDLADWYLSLRTWLIGHPHAILFSIFLMAMIEALAVIGVIIPAIPVLFVLSVLAAHADIPLGSLFVAGIVGAMAGDGVSYFLGRGFKHRIEDVWPFSRHPQWLLGAEAFVEKHGGKGIIFGRFIGPLRAFVPMAAGIFQMPPVYFIWMNFLSALAWAPFHLLPGYSLGAATEHDWLPGRPQLILVGAILIMVAVLTWLLPAAEAWISRRAARRPVPNAGRYYAADGQPEFQRATLRMALFSLAGFAVVAGLLPWLKPLDMTLTSDLFTLRQNTLDHLFVAAALLGDRTALLVFGGIVIGWLALRKEWELAALALGVAVLGLGLPPLLKQCFGIARPFLVMSPPESLAFPSGHAFTTVLVWGFVMLLIGRYGSAGVMGVARPLLLSLMLFTLASRPYLGVHWISDVVAGGLLGLGLLAVLRWIWYRLPAPQPGLLEALFVMSLALLLCIVLEVVPRFEDGMAALQPLPGVLPGYLLLP